MTTTISPDPYSPPSPQLPILVRRLAINVRSEASHVEVCPMPGIVRVVGGQGDVLTTVQQKWACCSQQVQHTRRA